MILTVPTPKRESNTLVQRLERFLDRGGRAPRLVVVHRLDRETSGLLVFARDRRTGEGLMAQFREHSPERVYHALVRGHLSRDEGTFDTHLVTGKSLTRYSTRQPDTGERAITHFRVEARLDDASLVAARLETGRRNQIRAHFAEAGHPVLGDQRYRAAAARHPRWPHARLALHAGSLAFRHPVTHELLRFETPLPREFLAFLRGGAKPGKA